MIDQRNSLGISWDSMQEVGIAQDGGVKYRPKKKGDAYFCEHERVKQVWERTPKYFYRKVPGLLFCAACGGILGRRLRE